MFDSYKLNAQGVDAVKNFKNLMATAVNSATDMMPECEEKGFFLAYIKQAVFVGTSAIAAAPGNSDGVTVYPV